MACTKPIRPAPTSLKATVWQHFEFHEVEVKTDKTYTVCKVCGTQLKDFGNTTNLRNFLARYHPELGEKQRPVAGASQRAIGQVMAQLQPNSKRAKGITKSTASFNALALRPYSVVENVGFGTMVFTLEPNTKYHLGVTSLTQPYRHATVKIRQKFWTLWWKWDFRIEIESNHEMPRDSHPYYWYWAYQALRRKTKFLIWGISWVCFGLKCCVCHSLILPQGKWFIRITQGCWTPCV